MISSVFPDVAEADKTNPCSWDWRTDVEAVTNSPFRQPQWVRACALVACSLLAARCSLL